MTADDAKRSSPKAEAPPKFIKRLTTSLDRSSAPAPPNLKPELRVKLGESNEETVVRWDRSGQHTVTWEQPLKLSLEGVVTVVAPGSCNLYQFPRLHGHEASAAQMSVVGELLLRIASIGHTSPAASSDFCVFDLPDSSGATPIMGLLLSNTKEAMKQCLALYALRPDMLLQVHFPGPFVGESALHVVAINRREDELCEMLLIAHNNLTGKQLESMFMAQPTGGFFRVEPTCLYGSTPFAYAATFGLRRALALMLSLSSRSRKINGLLDPNHPRMACGRTGFLPLHAVTASGNTAMYDFLVDLPNLPTLVAWRASESALSREGTASQFTALQLACYMGDQKMFKHIIQRRSEFEWRWGPLAQYKIALTGIDSVGGGANDVMEIIARLDAGERTQEFLLDTFLEGFLHKLFVQKWQRFGRAMHSVLRLFELLYLLSLVTLTMWLKESPEGCLANGKWLAACVLGFTVPMVEEDVRSMFLMWYKLRANILSNGAAAERSSAQNVRSRTDDFLQLTRWAHNQKYPMKFIGSALGCLASAALLAGYVPYGVAIEANGLDASGAPRMSESAVPLWTVLAIAVMVAFQVFFTGLLVPFQKTGVFFKTALLVVTQDVTVFGAIFAIFFCCYGLPTYIAYPRVGRHHVAYHPNYNGFLSSLHELNELALLGEPSAYSLEGGIPPNAQGWYDLVRTAVAGGKLAEREHMADHEWVEVAGFVIFYYVYLMMSSVLLLNLLIALMNHTFLSAQLASVLEWRVMFARNLLKLEMLAQTFEQLGWCKTNGGELATDGIYYVHNRLHDLKAYGSSDAEGRETHAVGYFGAVEESDPIALAAYASAAGLDVNALHQAARKVQVNYRRRMQMAQAGALKRAAARKSPGARIGGKSQSVDVLGPTVPTWSTPLEA
jgi:hypothetical protein